MWPNSLLTKEVDQPTVNKRSGPTPMSAIVVPDGLVSQLIIIIIVIDKWPTHGSEYVPTLLYYTSVLPKHKYKLLINGIASIHVHGMRSS